MSLSGDHKNLLYHHHLFIQLTIDRNSSFVCIFEQNVPMVPSTSKSHQTEHLKGLSFPQIEQLTINRSNLKYYMTYEI